MTAQPAAERFQIVFAVHELLIESRIVRLQSALHTQFKPVVKYADHQIRKSFLFLVLSYPVLIQRGIKYPRNLFLVPDLFKSANYICVYRSSVVRV